MTCLIVRSYKTSTSQYIDVSSFFSSFNRGIGNHCCWCEWQIAKQYEHLNPWSFEYLPNLTVWRLIWHWNGLQIIHQTFLKSLFNRTAFQQCICAFRLEVRENVCDDTECYFATLEIMWRAVGSQRRILRIFTVISMAMIIHIYINIFIFLYYIHVVKGW